MPPVPCPALPCHRYNGDPNPLNNNYGRMIETTTTACNLQSGYYNGSGVVVHSAFLHNPLPSTLPAAQRGPAYNGIPGNWNGRDWSMYADQANFFRNDFTREYYGGGQGNLNCSGTMKIAINAGRYSGNFPSKWAVAALLLYNRELTMTEISDVRPGLLRHALLRPWLLLYNCSLLW